MHAHTIIHNACCSHQIFCSLPLPPLPGLSSFPFSPLQGNDTWEQWGAPHTDDTHNTHSFCFLHSAASLIPSTQNQCLCNNQTIFLNLFSVAVFICKFWETAPLSQIIQQKRGGVTIFGILHQANIYGLLSDVRHKYKGTNKNAHTAYCTLTAAVLQCPHLSNCGNSVPETYFFSCFTFYSIYIHKIGKLFNVDKKNDKKEAFF